METSSKILIWSISFTILAAIGATAYIFLIDQNYYFTLEAQCDSTKQICFYRDCSTGECPPNELEHYRVFQVKAADFPKCTDNSCLLECESGSIACEEEICDSDEGYECTALEENQAESQVITEIEVALPLMDFATTSASTTNEMVTPFVEIVEADVSATTTIENASDD